jgi:hypothetical protein
LQTSDSVYYLPAFELKHRQPCEVHISSERTCLAAASMLGLYYNFVTTNSEHSPPFCHVDMRFLRLVFNTVYSEQNMSEVEYYSVCLAQRQASSIAEGSCTLDATGCVLSPSYPNNYVGSAIQACTLNMLGRFSAAEFGFSAISNSSQLELSWKMNDARYVAPLDGVLPFTQAMWQPASDERPWRLCTGVLGVPYLPPSTYAVGLLGTVISASDDAGIRHPLYYDVAPNLDITAKKLRFMASRCRMFTQQ